MSEIFTTLASSKCSTGPCGLCMVCEGCGQQNKSSSDSIMDPRRSLHQMQAVESSASVECPSLGSEIHAPLGAQREHDPF